MAGKGLFSPAAKFLANKINSTLDHEPDSAEGKAVKRGIDTLAKAKTAAASIPLIKYGAIVLVVVVVLVFAFGAIAGIAQAIDNISQPKSCVGGASASEVLAEAQKQGIEVTEDEKTALNENSENCGGLGVGYNGQTYPPTTGTVTTMYGVVDALHPRGHSGMDIANQCGTPIYAYAGGVVTSVVLGTEGKSSGGNFVYPGGTVIIKHTEELSTMYHHLKGSTTMVKVGDTVSAGQQIAAQWSNGHSTGCHLHFEAYMNGSRIDPVDLLRAAGYDYQYMKFFNALPPLPVPGGDGGSVTPAPAGSAKQIAQQKVAANGWGNNEWTCLESLWTRESGWRVNAINPRFNPRASAIPENQAYGIAQAAPGAKMASSGADWKTNPATQIDWGLGYIKGRYGTPCGAWAHSEKFNWY